ncbi:MAG: tRNA-dihydrouridine synthase, partial [Pseudomonadota bacterium]
IGRAAYHNPTGILAGADRQIYGVAKQDVDPVAAVMGMYDHIEGELAGGTRLHQITRHMLGAFAGRPGARKWRRHLSEHAHLPGAGLEVVEAALDQVAPARAAQ